MIIDTMKHCEQYYVLGDKFKKAFEWLKENDTNEMPEGNYEIDGQNIFALVQEYDTIDMDDCWLETHVDYIDLHYMGKGTEWFGFNFIERVGEPVTEYGIEEDDLLYRKECQFFLIQEDDFVICFPHDVHMPRKRPVVTTHVRKVCIKIKVNL